MPKAIPIPRKKHQQGTLLFISPLLFRAPMPHTLSHNLLEMVKERESDEELNRMSGDPFTKNPHKNLCGCRDRIPFTTSKFARLSGASQRASWNLYFYYDTKGASPTLEVI